MALPVLGHAFSAATNDVESGHPTSPLDRLHRRANVQTPKPHPLFFSHYGPLYRL
jgi:hypothetical protein